MEWKFNALLSADIIFLSVRYL